MGKKSVDHTIELLQQKIRSLQQEVDQLTNRALTEESATLDISEVLDHVPLAVLNIAKSGCVIRANKLVNSLFDLEEDYFEKALHIKDFARLSNTPLLEKIQKLIALDIPFDDELIMNISGEEKHYRSRGIPIWDKQGKVNSFLVIIGDITKRKLAEIQLINAKDKAEESNRLKTAFLTNMSHEIRTPMNHIIGFLDILLNVDLSMEDRAEYKQIVESSSAILLRKIDDIIDIARIESRQMRVVDEEVSLAEFMSRIYRINKEMLQKSGEHHIDFILKQDASLNELKINIDPLRMQQVLNNLIDNAFKFTPKGSVELGCYTASENELSFYVKDSGIGIDEAHHQKIFERFSQVDYSSTRKVDGTGLGLAISRGLIALMGGRMQLESEPGKGSTFTITLFDCLLVSEDKPAITTTVDQQELNWKNKSILIVEDDPHAERLLRIMLTDKGFVVSTAKTGKEAISMATSIKPDLVLMDLQLPEVDGFEATKAIKNKFPDLPVLAQTAYANAVEEEMAKAAGIDLVLSKPISKTTLYNSLKRVF